MASFKRTPNGVYICDQCTITGDVKLGVDSSVWFSAVIRGDVAPVTIGARTNVQDGAVVHCDTDVPNVIEEDVVIGHRAVVHGTVVGAGSLIGMGAVLLSRTKIGRGCLVAAGSVVPPDLVVPDGMVVMGVPGKIARPVKPAEVQYMKWLVPHYVELAQKYVEGKMGPAKVE